MPQGLGADDGRMRESKVDGFWDGVDRLGQRIPGVNAIGGTRFSVAFQKFGRNHPFFGSLTQGVFFAGAMFGLFSLRSGGGHESLVAWICGISGALFFMWMYLYNHRHHLRDRDLDAVPSAETNRLKSNR